MPPSRSLSRVPFSDMVFTTGQIAFLCRVAPRTVAKWFDSGKLVGFRIPNCRKSGKTHTSDGRVSSAGERRVVIDELLRFLVAENFPIEKMPELHEQIWYKVLLVACEETLVEEVKKMLPDTDRYCVAVAEDVYQMGYLMCELRPDAIVMDTLLGRGTCLTIGERLAREEQGGYRHFTAIAAEDEVDLDAYQRHGFTVAHKRPIDPVVIATAIGEHAAQLKRPRVRTLEKSARPYAQKNNGTAVVSGG